MLIWLVNSITMKLAAPWRRKILGLSLSEYISGFPYIRRGKSKIFGRRAQRKSSTRIQIWCSYSSITFLNHISFILVVVTDRVQLYSMCENSLLNTLHVLPLRLSLQPASTQCTGRQASSTVVYTPQQLVDRSVTFWLDNLFFLNHILSGWMDGVE